MSDSDATQPTPKPQAPVSPGPTPTGYQRTQGGGFKWQPPTPERLAQLLPQYHIEALIGRGGMGAVYKGTQKALERPVAIKILPPEVDDEDASYTERFKNEAKIMARLEHPAIVPVHDFGETSEGQLYFVMGFVDGTDIHQMIHSQGKLPPEHALAITAHVCDALGYAHQHGIIHRDIKPSNVLINMQGQVKVADFGLAKAQDTSQSSGLTKSGLAMGTPDYVAPETLSIGMVPDGRADLYAVGVMLYQMLTGQVPRGAFDLPSKLSGCDPRYDQIVMKAMKYDREDRYSTATDLRRDLDVILTAPMVQSGGQSSAAIPMQAVAQKPVAKGPQAPDGRRVRQNSEGTPADAPNRTLASAPTAKSKTPLFLGLGAAAAIGIGAFVMFGGDSRRVRQNAESAPASPPPTRSLSIAPTASAPKPTAQPPKPISAPSFVSKPTEQQFPPGKWVKVFTKLEDLPPALRTRQPSDWKDGWIKAEGSAEHLHLPPHIAGNYALRALFRRRADNKVASYLNLRVHGSDNQRYQLFLSDGGILSLQSQQNGKFALLTSTPSERKLKPGETFQLSLGIVGSRLVTRLGSELMRSHVDATHASGTGFFHLQDDIRDIEVINLDGLPEAEALRILGVDEKGNDLRKPAAVAATTPAPSVSKSPPLPASASSDKFPPGQWVKPYTKFEDLPLKARNELKLTWKDGWIDGSTSTDEFALFTIVGTRGKNQGIRARLKHVPGAETPYPATLSLRAVPGKRYSFNYSFKDQQARIALATQATEAFTSQAPRNLPVVGAEYDLEFYAIGEKLIGRINGELQPVSSDNRIAEGDITLQIKHLIRDIEVINLDGLPEAEALRILGVDEKGNDLRKPAAPMAAAAKPNPQVAEPVPQTWIDLTEEALKMAQAKPQDLEVVGRTIQGKVAKAGRLIFASTKDAVLRVTYSSQVATKVPLLEMRYSQSDGFYMAVPPATITHYQGVDKARSLVNETVPSVPNFAGEHVMMMACEGDHLTWWLDGVLISSSHDDALKEGPMRIRLDSSNTLISKIEYGELGGQSLAAKQMEQAKAADAMAAIPELKTLHEQFVKLTAERVTAPFEAEVAKLNAGYLGGLDRKIAEERGKGNLDGVLALEEEKKLVVASSGTRSQGPDGLRLPTEATTGAVPATDADTTPATLKDLRKIYRDAFAKLDATRAASLKALTDPLTIRLKQLESTLTQQNRIEHAKTVREYRENLAKEGSSNTPIRNATPGSAAATTNEADKSVLLQINFLAHFYLYI